jgi:hypothetical protein
LQALRILRHQGHETEPVAAASVSADDAVKPQTAAARRRQTTTLRGLSHSLTVLRRPRTRPAALRAVTALAKDG